MHSRQQDVLTLNQREWNRPTRYHKVHQAGHRQVTRALSGADADLADYILRGPLTVPCKLTVEGVAKNLQAFKDLGDVVIENLGFGSLEQLDEVQKLRIFRYYLPVFFWCQAQLEEHRHSGGSGEPLVIGMQAPQGCGKTTLVEQLEFLFEHTGSKAASVSIDDFYLTFEDQQALAKSQPGNSLVELRSNAGTHDVDFGLAAISRLKGCRTADSTVTVPRYDKAAHGGKGTRAAEDTWPVINGPVEVILFEGWMLGFEPVTKEAAAAVDPNLVGVNERLQDYQRWHEQVDAWLILKVSDPAYVYRWREQAEVVLRSKGKGGMTEAQVKDFVDRYMPAYRAYLPHLYAKGPERKNPNKALVIEINEGRGLVEQQPEPLW
ncbi:hypothetical protein WJX73_006615 [Symbiochloris irregularis]|uniref:Glycerate kinase n=1 Tax=Symbiochloris irregularis TaxID=706552 RepID=A0AAW1Q3X7_9CHLO